MSLAGRAHGRAYLAFCPEPEREHLLQIVETLPGMPSDYSSQALRDDLAAIRSAGFAMRAPYKRNQTNTVAVPCWWKGRLVATLGMTFFARSVPDPIAMVAALKAESASAHHEATVPATQT